MASGYVDSEMAESVWSVIAAELNDRGCFDDIDDETMDDLDASCIRLVHAALSSATCVGLFATLTPEQQAYALANRETDI